MSNTFLTQRVNTYFAILLITIAGAFATITVVRVATNSYTQLGLALYSGTAL